MKTILLLLGLAILLPVQQDNPKQQDKIGVKNSGHEYSISASPEECTDVLYTEIATGLTKDAGGATPLSVTLAPKLYHFTCKCPGGDSVSGPVMVGERQSYKFICKAPPQNVEEKPLTGSCKINTQDARNVNDNRKIGDQNVFHIRCAAEGQVQSAKYDSCAFAGGEPCRSINPRDELSGPCADDPKAACIYYQTNDGNYKVIAGSFTYWKKKS
jgi:hypothetical protein